MTVQAVEKILTQVEEACAIAESQLTLMSMSEHEAYVDSYCEAQYLLELAYKELDALAHSTRGSDHYAVQLAQTKVNTLQHEMITLRH
ncbi:MAG: DUF2524 family protein [Bacilli bacterium]